MSLTTWEFKKILKHRSAKIAFCFAILYALFSTIYNGLYLLGSTTGTGAKRWDGPNEIARQYNWAESWQGSLTEEKLAQAKVQHSIAYQPQNETTYSDGSIGPSEEAWNKYVAPLGDIPAFLQRTFYLIPEFSNYRDFKNLPVSYAKNYYAMRAQILADYLTSQVPDNSARTFFLEQSAKVKTPFYYDWYHGQSLYLEMYSIFTLFTGIAICIGLASIFAGEYQQKTDSVLLCARFGRKKLARAKLISALLAAIMLYFTCSAVYLIGQFVFVGTRALNCPIQIIKPIATAPLTILQAEAFAFILGLLGVIAITAITTALSAKLSAPFTVIIISLLILILPFSIVGGLPSGLQALIGLFPFASDYTELFRTNLYHIFNFKIWSPYMLLACPIVFILLCLPAAHYSFVHHQA